MMIDRPKLMVDLVRLLGQRPLVWLSGVRRVGKTTLCKLIPNSVYYDCELPSVRAQLEDPEFFWSRHKNELVVLDEVHRLCDPSNTLKIATDHHPSIRVVATGSSTLAARQKFKDTLTDRKRDLWMHPFLISEIKNAEDYELDRRLLHGGLPPAYLSPAPDDDFYAEWLDSFWAKDVQELFSIDKKTSFLKLAALVLRQSGEVFEATSFAGPCEISRQTVSNYLDVLATTLFAIVLRPYSEKRANDIVSTPKVYGFDTGFVCFSRGWSTLRPEDRGGLIEHVVLGELIRQFGKQRVYYWRDKRQHEVDFVVKPVRGSAIHAIECKSSYSSFSTRNLRAFRRAYPEGMNFLMAANVMKPTPMKRDGLEIWALPIGDTLSFGAPP